MVYKPNRVRSSAPTFGDSFLTNDGYDDFAPNDGEVVDPVVEQYMNEEEVEEEREDTGDEYMVEKILGMKKRRNTVQYLVKWKGWDDSYNQWIYLKNLIGCDDLIEAYNQSLKPKEPSKFVDRALILGILVMASVFVFMFVSIIEIPN